MGSGANSFHSRKNLKQDQTLSNSVKILMLSKKIKNAVRCITTTRNDGQRQLDLR